MPRRSAYLLALLVLALPPKSPAQVQVGDDLRMNANGLIDFGYSGYYGSTPDIRSTHSLNWGGSGQVNGSFYNPNFLNFTVTPYYNQSRADSSYQSLASGTGVSGNVNFFTGGRFPGNVSFHDDRNSTGNFGLVGTPNFTTIGTSRGFGIGWSALIPDWPTFSVSYSQGRGDGTIYGTNQESSGSTKTLNLRSTYRWAGWNLNGSFQHLSTESTVPLFLAGENGDNFVSSHGNSFGINGNHNLPWNGTLSASYLHTNYSTDYGQKDIASPSNGTTTYTINQENINAVFHPTQKWAVYASQFYISNLDGYLYQSFVNGGSGVPIQQPQQHSNSETVSGAVNYNFTKNLWGQAQITYFDQNYLERSYNGSYFSATLGYNRRILETFTVSASAIDSTNKFTDNDLGYVLNLNAFHNFGLWEFSSTFNYSQNVQTLLVTYTTSYYLYNANVHRRLGRGMQWTAAFNGNHSGFTQSAGTSSHGEGFSSSLGLRRITVSGNYTQNSGQSILTSSGIAPISTPGLPPVGFIVYNGKSYGGGISITPLPRMLLTGTYSRATSDTLNGGILSNNRTQIFYSQLQYHMRQITMLAGYTKFFQGISAATAPAGNEYSYFVGVTRYFNFF